MDNCIFCKIIGGEIPSSKVYEDDKILAFHDINPAAPVHIIIIPKTNTVSHIDSLNSITPDNAHFISHIMLTIPALAKQFNLSDGYRVVTNIGQNGGQTVNHLHFHLLGGRPLTWQC